LTEYVFSIFQILRIVKFEKLLNIVRDEKFLLKIKITARISKLLIYSPVTIVSNVINNPNALVLFISTVDTFVIPPFFAAVLMLASPLNTKPNTTVDLAVPTLLPIVLLVALTGRAIEQLEIIAADAIKIANILILLII
jgi:hypothetical protein